MWDFLLCATRLGFKNRPYMQSRVLIHFWDICALVLLVETQTLSSSCRGKQHVKEAEFKIVNTAKHLIQIFHCMAPTQIILPPIESTCFRYIAGCISTANLQYGRLSW